MTTKIPVPPFKLHSVQVESNKVCACGLILRTHSKYSVILKTPTNFKRSCHTFILGQRLYSIYINDQLNAVTQGEVEVCADDTTTYCIGDNFDIVTTTHIFKLFKTFFTVMVIFVFFFSNVVSFFS